MNGKKIAVVTLVGALIFFVGAPRQMRAQDDKTPYPHMAPLDQNLIADRSAKSALIGATCYAP